MIPKLFRRTLDEPEVPSFDHPEVKGDMDAPTAETVLERGDILAGGWVIDRDHPIRHVEVLVNGVRLAVVTMKPNREDITAAFPEHAADRPGWTTWVDLSEVSASAVTIDAVAVREGGERVTFSSVDCQMESGAPATAPTHAARWITELDFVEGFNRIYGVATCPGGVSRVDVRVDGVDVGPARVSLPGVFLDVDQPEDRIGAFEIVHRFSAGDTGEQRIEATITCMDGSTFELEPTTIEVASAPVDNQVVEAFRPERPAPIAATGPRRVLVFTHSLSLGGGQLYLQELLVRLGARGYEFVVVSPTDGVLREQLESLGHEVHVSGEFSLGDPAAYEGRMREFLAWAIDKGCSAAIGNTMLVFPGIDAAERLGLPVIWAIHESFDLDQFWMEAHAQGAVSKHARDRARVALNAATSVVFEAAATRQQYEPHLAPGAGAVVPYGVDVEGIVAYRAANDRSEIRRQLGFEDHHRLLLCIGTVEPRKAQLMLAHAFSTVDDPDARLVFVGARPGHYVDTLQLFVEESGETRIRIEPIVADTYRWYEACDALVCASDIESLPRSILEAMLFNRPIASTAVFGVPELIGDGIHGWLCEPRDVLDLARCIERVLRSSVDERVGMGAIAGELVTGRHAPHVYVDWFDAVLERSAITV